MQIISTRSTERAGALSTGLMLRPELRGQLPATVPAQVRKAAGLLLSEQPAVVSFTSKDLRKALYQPISGVALLLGHSNTLTDGKDLQMMGTALASVIRRRFPAMKLPEVTEAFIRGASGEWPLPNGFLAPTLPNFTHWLQCYQDQCRSRAITELRALQAAEDQKLLGPAKLDEGGLVVLVVGMANEYRDTQNFPTTLDAGDVCYDWLKRIGAFEGFKTNAQLWHRMQKESFRLSQQRSLDTRQRERIKSFGEQLRRGWPAEHPLADTVLSRCKKWLLREWLRYQVVNKVDVAQKLEQQVQAAKCQAA